MSADTSYTANARCEWSNCSLNQLFKTLEKPCSERRQTPRALYTAIGAANRNVAAEAAHLGTPC
eukprot:1544923-Pleurochrysis_carterae.AAC.1